MNLSQKTIECLRKIINEESEYKGGPALVKFFNHYGEQDVYGQGFPSRWLYTENKLNLLNGTDKIEQCIKDVFSPINYIENNQKLVDLVDKFNSYLAYDGWNIVIKGRNVLIVNQENCDLSHDEDLFLKSAYQFDIEGLNLGVELTKIIEDRIIEIQGCIENGFPLASIFLIGSTMEGILSGIASKFPNIYNTSNVAPKGKNNEVRKFQEWTLNDLIEVSCDCGFIKEDVKRFSQSLRYFRNYIHPREQLKNNFCPDKHTSDICFYVLKATICQIVEREKHLEKH